MGYIRRVGDKRYRIVYDVRPKNGKARQQKTETLSGVSKSEAEAYLAQRKLREASKARLKEVTTAKLFEQFMNSRRAANRSPKTLDRYETLFDSYIEPALGSTDINDLRQDDLTAWYARWAQKGKSGRALHPRTVRHIHDLLRAMLNYAVRKELAVRNVAALVSSELPKAIKQEPFALDEGQLKQLLSAADAPTDWAKSHDVISAQAWFHAAVWFAAYTGARRGETLAIRWSDLDLKERTVLIGRSLAETKNGLLFKTVKNERSRRIVIPKTLVAVLRAHKKRQDEERGFFREGYNDQDLVFAMPTGDPVLPWTFTASFRYLVERAGIPYISLHGLRDTHASLLAKAGVPLEVISKRLGHSNIMITADRYLHVYRERDMEAADQFDRIAA